MNDKITYSSPTVLRVVIVVINVNVVLSYCSSSYKAVARSHPERIYSSSHTIGHVRSIRAKHVTILNRLRHLLHVVVCRSTSIMLLVTGLEYHLEVATVTQSTAVHRAKVTAPSLVRGPSVVCIGQWIRPASTHWTSGIKLLHQLLVVWCLQLRVQA